METLLRAEHRELQFVQNTRPGPAESQSAYQSRLSQSISETRARIAWLCLPPGAHVPILIEAALASGVHVIVEKPWIYDRSKTAYLIDKARQQQLVTGIHHEYCFLDALALWRRNFSNGLGLQFHGSFKLGRPDHLGISALDNLGSHLLAIREYAAPRAEISEIVCDYETRDDRRAWLTRGNETVASIDFLHNTEPLIQRFLAAFEAALDTGSFPFDLQFGSRVLDALDQVRQRSPQSPPTPETAALPH